MSQIDHAKHIKTIFCDIDGCVFNHESGDLLPGVWDTFRKWRHKGYTIILVTGRPESWRDITLKQLLNAGLCCHQLVMNLPRGQRVIINDLKSDSNTPTAANMNLKRDEGMENVDI